MLCDCAVALNQNTASCPRPACESSCAIASRPVHHARLRSTPALDLASRGVASGRPSQAKLPSGRLSTRLEWCHRPPACHKPSTPDRPLRHPGPQATSSARPAAPAVHACRPVCKVCDNQLQISPPSSDAACRNTHPSVTCCDAAVIRPVKPQDLVFSPRSQWRRSTPLGFSECNYSSRHIPLDDTTPT